MISSAHLIGFTLASLVIIVIPGPGVLFVIGRALSHGRRTAVATAAGHAAGNYLVATCVAVGLGTLLQRSAQVFIAVKLAGALYLVYLGVQAIRHRHSLAAAMSQPGAAGEGWRALRDGVVVGVTNPKTFILFGAILPQFIDRGSGNVPAQMLLLALISVCLGLATDCTWGLAASGVRSWFARSPRRYELVGGAGGLAMIGVGVTVALTGQTKLAGQVSSLTALSDPAAILAARREREKPQVRAIPKIECQTPRLGWWPPGGLGWWWGSTAGRVRRRLGGPGAAWRCRSR
jgi:threonine/homoserine/homoserine lactone efflux protein